MGGEVMAVIFTLLELWLLSHTGAPADQGQQGQQGEQVILVSGGEDVTSVEVFSPALQPATRCTLPKLPGSRYLHTADGWTLCGSSGSRFCLVLAGGRWAWSRQLGSKRAGHASWRVPGGVLLLGGWGSPRTVDLLTDGGTVQRNPFLLKYPIKDACAIADGDTVVLTGGQNTMRRVSRYGTGGWLEDLPSMNLGRADHGCASFLQEGDKVFIVSGVFGASSEVLRAGAWTLVAPLPAPVTGVRGAALANTVYMMGGQHGNKNFYDNIWRYDAATEAWEEAGTMLEPRGFHAVSLVPRREVAQFCH